MPFFNDGPLADGRSSEIHSFVVHMKGDGHSSIGAYVRVYTSDRDEYQWNPNLPLSWDEEDAALEGKARDE